LFPESSIPTKQVFSYGIVEAKRFRRTLTAVINGKTVPQAVREGLVEGEESQQEATDEGDLPDDGESLFLPEKQPVSASPFAKSTEQANVNPFAKSVEQVTANPFAKPATPGFNPQAPPFALGMFQQPVEVSANPFAGFGALNPSSSKPKQAPSNLFAKAGSPFPSTGSPKVDSPTTAAKSANPFSNSSGNGFSFTPQSTPPKPISQPFVFGAGGFTASTTAAPIHNAPATDKPFPFTGTTSQPTSTSITHSQPPAFSWHKPDENTQNTGTWRTIRFLIHSQQTKCLFTTLSIVLFGARRSRSSHLEFFFFFQNSTQLVQLHHYRRIFYLHFCPQAGLEP
jgi:hypothetical protein